MKKQSKNTVRTDAYNVNETMSRVQRKLDEIRLQNSNSDGSIMSATGSMGGVVTNPTLMQQIYVLWVVLLAVLASHCIIILQVREQSYEIESYKQAIESLRRDFHEVTYSAKEDREEMQIRLWHLQEQSFRLLDETCTRHTRKLGEQVAELQSKHDSLSTRFTTGSLATRRIEIMDENNTMRAFVGVAENNAAIALLDSEGNARWEVVASASSTSLTVRDSQNRARHALRITEQSSWQAMTDDQGIIRLESFASSAGGAKQVLRDHKGRLRLLQMTSLQEKDQDQEDRGKREKLDEEGSEDLVFFSIYDTEGQVRFDVTQEVSLLREKKNSVTLTLREPGGMPSLRQSVTADGVPTYMLLRHGLVTGEWKHLDSLATPFVRHWSHSQDAIGEKKAQASVALLIGSVPGLDDKSTSLILSGEDVQLTLSALGLRQFDNGHRLRTAMGLLSPAKYGMVLFDEAGRNRAQWTYSSQTNASVFLLLPGDESGGVGSWIKEGGDSIVLLGSRKFDQNASSFAQVLQEMAA